MCVVIDVQVLDGVLDVSVIPADPVADQDRYVRARQGHEESCLQTRVLVYIVCLVLHLDGWIGPVRKQPFKRGFGNSLYVECNQN